MSDRYSPEILAEKGQGRATIVICDEASLATAESLFDLLGQERRVLLLKLSAAAVAEWAEASRALLGQLKGRGIKQACFISLGRASDAVLAACLEEVRAVRTLLLYNASARLEDHWLDRLAARLESSLPMGLPFRTRVKGFDARPFLQRIRCPVLIGVAEGASPVLARQAALLAAHIPTSWLLRLPETGTAASLCRLMQDFDQVPARCPQKNR
jgi:pimeloyl-ACP methyl ester carboxylesterase